MDRFIACAAIGAAATATGVYLYSKTAAQICDDVGEFVPGTAGIRSLCATQDFDRNAFLVRWGSYCAPNQQQDDGDFDPETSADIWEKACKRAEILQSMLNDVTKVFVKIQNAQTFEQRRDLIMFLRLSCRRHTLMRSHFGTSSSDPSTSSASQEHANDLEFAHHAMSQHIEMRLEEMGLAGSSSGGSDYHSYDMTIPRPLWPRLSQLLNRS